MPMKGLKAFSLVFFTAMVCMAACPLSAQTAEDSLVVARPVLIMDSTLVGADIVQLVESGLNGIKVNQSVQLASALNGHKTLTGSRKLSGYRIRIYFSNSQSARNESAMVEEKFKENFPGVPVYRTYPNPHFKVAVGNYRTKSDALKALEEIKEVFKDAYIIMEREMDFPAIK